jgi:hypothetical protein
MSQSFRPVKEIWNMHSSCFIHPAGNSAQRQGHGDLPYVFRVKRHCFLSQIFSQTGTPRKAAQLAGYWSKNFLQNIQFSLLQTPESRTYISRGGILEGSASRPDAHLRSTRSRRSFETSAVWIAVMGAQSAARSIGRSRPGNS